MNEAIKVSMVSLGCARNLVDSEVLLGHAVAEGLQVTREPRDADVVVVNTCGFIEAAKQESIDTILSLCKLKEEGSLKGVVAVGCLVQRYAEELQKELPEVDALFQISDYSGVPKAIRRIVNGSEARFVPAVDGGRPKDARTDVRRHLTTPKSYAYLRISEGCDHTCTFCAIPSMRGRNRSKPREVLVEEARNLAAAGVQELVIVAEDSTAWGLDLYRHHALHELVAALAEVEGIRWIRLLYAYPHTVRKELTSVMRDNPKVVPYLDIPIQHISGRMLKAMKRGVHSQQVKDILWRLRDEVPGIAVRSTYIVGFPGETEQDFAELLEWTREYRFERLGVFRYSAEEGTPAAELPDPVDPDLAETRRATIMAVQKDILDARNAALVGTRMQVLIDGFGPAGDAIGRTHADAPEIDCVVKVVSGEAQAGAFVTAEITGVDGYDLVGRAV